MDNFTFCSPTKFIFGKDTELQVGEELKNYNCKVLLHYGGGSIKTSGLYDRVKTSLESANIDYIELGGVQPNPRLSLVNKGIELCREHNIGLVLAVGGGSVIDSSKAIALGTPYNGDVWDFYEGKAQPEKCLTVATILTIPAAGSESSPNTVITNDIAPKPLKYGFGAQMLRPAFSILNPELIYTLSKYQIACGSADILAHLCERYFTNSKGVSLNDRLLEQTMKETMRAADKIINGEPEYSDWANLMWCSTMAHNNVLGVGRAQDWGSHAIEHEVSAIYDIAHGAGLAIVMPSWMEYVKSNDINRFAEFAVNAMGVEPNFFNLEETANKGIKAFRNFMKSIGLPTTLKEADIPKDKIEEMATKCFRDGTRKVGQFVELTVDSVKEILENCAE